MFLQAGIINMTLSPYAQKSLFSSLPQKEVIKELKLSIKSSAKIHRNSASIECLAVDYNEIVIIYSKSKTGFNQMCVGDILLLDYRPMQIENSNTVFDYKKFQARRRCFTYGYLENSHFKLVKPKKYSLLSKIEVSREKLISKIREKYNGQEWCDILIALVSGNKSYLEERTKEVYKASGTVHLMAVSGLHMGFVYLFALNILSFLGKRGIIRYLKAVIIIVTIWLYCAFSGFSPSSIRASIMISILIISEIHTGKYISLNALCASALIITVVKPHSLLEIGFQLSYVAILSIFLLNPYFNQKRVSKTK